MPKAPVELGECQAQTRWQDSQVVASALPEELHHAFDLLVTLDPTVATLAAP